MNAIRVSQVSGLYYLKVLHICPFCRPKNENVKFQRHLKDNTNLELPSKEGGLKMSLNGKITTIS